MSLLDSLDLLIYLDEVLTKNLNSLIINGYIEKRTSKWIEDRTLTARNHMEEREQNYGEDDLFMMNVMDTKVKIIQRLILLQSHLKMITLLKEEDL